MTPSPSTQQSDSERLRLAVLVGSTRPGRRSYLVAEWAAHLAREALAGRADVSIIDIADFDLPLLDEPQPGERRVHRFERMLDELVQWSAALRPLRASVPT
ncbi:NAD(P)H-dependent oxidoreductase [Gordonia sp. L191]|uniref:NADPH-dependent FMN reductase n=1 Tax=Gordonia sp. L191 TaxID=2982699 RepID=UPI0024BFFFC3|nr:NAD(P)H-dependent oxidoreductase [Gordonia sp. L191]WHU46590.1 NAD(P)H-dependent oxidoreductase [Gordonia sp. L191]